MGAHYQVSPQALWGEVSTPGADVSLIRGGPFYRLQRLTRLIGPDRWNLGRRITSAVVVGWLPLVLLTALLNPSVLSDLLRDYRVTARMLVAVPVLLIGQVVMDARFKMVLRHLREIDILRPTDLQRLDAIIARVMRWRDSLWPEVLLVALVYVNVTLALSSHMHDTRPWALGGDGAVHLLPAGWYYVLVSQLVYQFLAAISAWKWLLWSYFAFHLSRLEMNLVPTHPDQHGGLGFLGLSPMGSAPLAFAVSVAIGGNWRFQILAHRAHLADFKIDAIVLLAILLIVSAGPLVFFVPRLAKLRLDGLLEYGTLGQIHSVDFHKKWVLDRNRNADEFLAAPEISALIDYGSSYENIQKMQPFPLDKGSLVVLALAVALPLLPVLLTEVPIAEVLKALLQAAK